MQPRRLSKAARLGLASVFIASAGMLAGCDLFNTQKPGGRLASLDQHTYISTTYSPKTVRLVDVRTLEEIWSVDVPVGQKLVMRFYPDKIEDNLHNPDAMRWRIFPADRNAATLENQMPVPPSEARRIEWELRAVPEYAPDSPAAVDIMTGGGPVAPAPAPEGNG